MAFVLDYDFKARGRDPREGRDSVSPEPREGLLLSDLTTITFL